MNEERYFNQSRYNCRVVCLSTYWLFTVQILNQLHSLKDLQIYFLFMLGILNKKCKWLSDLFAVFSCLHNSVKPASLTRSDEKYVWVRVGYRPYKKKNRKSIFGSRVERKVNKIKAREGTRDGHEEEKIKTNVRSRQYDMEI